MSMNSGTISKQYAFRQTTEPINPPDGAIWINPAGGVNGNNRERYLFDRDAGTWDLVSSVGPDTPSREASGGSWTDTSSSPATSRVYDSGSGWVSLAPSSTKPNVVKEYPNHPNGSFTEKYPEIGNVTTRNWNLPYSYNSITVIWYEPFNGFSANWMELIDADGNQIARDSSPDDITDPDGARATFSGINTEIHGVRGEAAEFPNNGLSAEHPSKDPSTTPHTHSI